MFMPTDKGVNQRPFHSFPPLNCLVIPHTNNDKDDETVSILAFAS